MKPTLLHEYVSTSQIAEALGVGVSTVKRWVEEGLLPAQKTAGGHRKLLLADVLEFARQNNLPVRDPTLLKALGRKPRARAPRELASELFEALLDGKSLDARALLFGAYHGGTPIEILADEIVAPAMNRIGREWETGRIDVMHEHQATQLCVSALYELKSVLESRALRKLPTALGGAIEGDFSELPTLLAQLTLIDAGWKAINLGPNTPLNSLSVAVAELSPRLVWLSVSHLPENGFPLHAYRELYRKCASSEAAIVVGGRALTEHLRTTIPYTAFGDGLSHLTALARTLHTRPRRPKRGRPPSKS